MNDIEKEVHKALVHMGIKHDYSLTIRPGYFVIHLPDGRDFEVKPPTEGVIIEVVETDDLGNLLK